jgi:hypothetical protein
MSNKCSHSAVFSSVIMHIRISGFSAEIRIILLQCIHHQCEPGDDTRILRYLVGLFRRMFPVKFHHQTSYLPHILSAVKMKSQFDIYFISGKVFLNKTCSKLNKNFKYSGLLENVRFIFTNHSWINAGNS